MVDAEVEASRAWGVVSEKLDHAALRRRAPYLSGKGIRTAYFVPDDIYIEEPIWLLNAYLEALSMHGASVIGSCPVTRIAVEDGAVVGVDTPRGFIRTPVVVDAAGAWARAVGGLAAIDVPVAPVRHQLLITRQIPGLAAQEPIVRIIDASAYLRPARGGLMMGGMEQSPLALDPRQDPNFSIADTPLDMTILDAFTDALGPLTPALGDTPVAEHRGGLFTMTPDGRFLAGPVDGLRGFWTATGCNGSGFSISAGIGQALAEWIVGGEPPLDMSSFDPNRFGPGPFDDNELAAAGMWQCANYYTPASV
jgi:glycine/D-amino acid oxidase-like deaminating enzyme